MELRKKLVGVITNQQVLRHVSKPRHQLATSVIFIVIPARIAAIDDDQPLSPPTSTNDDDNQPTSTTDSGDDHRQPVGPTSKYFLFFPFLVSFY